MQVNMRKLGVALMIALAGASGVGDARAQDALPGEAAAEPEVVEAAMSADELGIPPGFMIIEGDIIVPEDFYESRGTYQTNLWPAGIVPYEFDPNVSVANKDAMVDEAMAVWEDIANINFVVHDTAFNFLHIQNNASVSNSSVGMQPWPGGQVVNISNWNPNSRTMVHELGHALGFWHEQSRADRDTYVRIEVDNILFGMGYNFDIYPGFPWPSGEYGPYDFDSIMHYGACAFSTCGSGFCTSGDPDCRTITVLPPNEKEQGNIGRGLPPSFWDARVMSFLYPQSNWRFVDGAWTGTQNGTFLEPHQSVLLGLSSTPTGGTLWIQPGDYAGAFTWSNAVTIRAPLVGGGAVTLGIGR